LTPEDRVLDVSIISGRGPLFLYRLARAKYANLSGIGAALRPGRWNSLGEEVLYTSLEQGVPLLELLVHIPKNLIPTNLALMTIKVRGQWELFDFDREVALIDNETGATISVYPTLEAANANRRFYSAYFPVPIKKGEDGPPRHVIGMAVPSVIVPVWNFVLYPRSESFWSHVSLESVEPFEFDAPLIPENTPVEPL